LAYLRLEFSIGLDLDERALAPRAQQHIPSARSARDNELRVSPPVAEEKT